MSYSIVYIRYDKTYVKDTNGKYRLVEKQETQRQQPLTLQVVDERLKRLALFAAGR
jgi:hypothetical protein